MRILVAEDNTTLADGLAAVLRAAGYAVDVVGDGVSADAVISTTDFDLVVLDLNLPEMDGLEATRRTRAHEAGTGQRIPIVALTANAMVGDREQCLEAGMDDFLSKPFQLRELAAAIQRWCPEQVAPDSGKTQEMTG